MVLTQSMRVCFYHKTEKVHNISSDRIVIPAPQHQDDSVFLFSIVQVSTTASWGTGKGLSQICVYSFLPGAGSGRFAIGSSGIGPTNLCWAEVRVGER